MDNRSIQRLYQAAGYYRGDIDGDLGPKSMKAAGLILDNRASELPSGYSRWSASRRAIAAAQLILKHAGYEQVGEIDGYSGPSTEYALTLWTNFVDKGESEELFRDGEEEPQDDLLPSHWPRQLQSELTRFYGTAGGAQCTAGKVNLPFPMKIAWNKSQQITRFSCHEKVADSAERVYRRIADAYSPKDITRLGFDLFGGCYNFRKKRGGSTLSTHAWGIAIDQDPERNRLKWGRGRALLATPECEEYWRIWADADWVSLGRARDYDWMHVQAARL
jgi:hypothetical protein